MTPRRYGPFAYLPITRRPKLTWHGSARVALGALDAALEYICSHAGVWRATGWEIVQHFLAQQPQNAAARDL